MQRRLIQTKVEKFFYSIWIETTLKPSKVAAGKKIFSSVFVTDVICLDECFLSCVNCQNIRMTFSADLKDLKSTKKLLIILFRFHYFYCISYRKCAKLSPSTARRSCSQIFLKIICSYVFFSGENTCAGFLFHNIAGLQTCNFVKKRVQHRCFPVNIPNF